MSRDYNKVLVKRIKKVISEYTKEAQTRVKQMWSQYNDKDLGNAMLGVLIDADLTGIVSATISAVGQKFWVLEFGRGSLMERDREENPWLDSYLNSDVFNKDRIGHDYAIIGRKKGSYKDLDGNEHKSTGTLEGVNLETWYHSKPYDYPIAPKRIVQTVLYGDNDNGLLSEMREALAEESLAYTLGLMFDDYAEKEIKIKL